VLHLECKCHCWWRDPHMLIPPRFSAPLISVRTRHVSSIWSTTCPLISRKAVYSTGSYGPITLRPDRQVDSTHHPRPRQLGREASCPRVQQEGSCQSGQQSHSGHSQGCPRTLSFNMSNYTVVPSYLIPSKAIPDRGRCKTQRSSVISVLCHLQYKRLFDFMPLSAV
jgi:hypothetical protein